MGSRWGTLASSHSPKTYNWPWCECECLNGRIAGWDESATCPGCLLPKDSWDTNAFTTANIASAFVAISFSFLLGLHCLILVSLCGNVCVSRHASHVYMPREGDWGPFWRIWKRPQVDFAVWGPKTNTCLRAFTTAVCCLFQTLLVSCFIFIFFCLRRQSMFSYNIQLWLEDGPYL